MKKDILDRYDKDENAKIILNIASQKVSDIYNEFDKASSFTKKDLDEELVTYIIESVKEIGSEDFSLKFCFEETIDSKSKNKVAHSIKTFFNYLQVLEKELMREQIKNAFIFMAIGIFFVALAITFKTNEGLVNEVISEGMMVAGWVSLWEALATFLIKWLPLTKKLKLFKKIADAPVMF